MGNQITRRDFLKLAGLLPLSIAMPGFVKSLPSQQSNGKTQNVLVVVFDAFSAHNISLYGYQRETTPNIARLAERGIVYHRHYSGGNFTSPGTASLLTGTLPWTHRAFQHRGTVEDSFVDKNIFKAFHEHYRISYSHNPLVNVLTEQFGKSLDELVPREKLLLRNYFDVPALFKKDEDIADVSWTRTVKRRMDGYAYSLFLAHLYELYNKQIDEKLKDVRARYPRGIPGLRVDNHFLLENAIDWLGKSLNSLHEPFLGYFHFLPPHAPYRTHRDFYGRFKNDGWMPARKPLDIFSDENDYQFDIEVENRTAYDEFILHVDRELGRLFDYLDTSGLSENTWVVLTSDHGEMFERGVIGHTTPLLYDPIIRTPLIIFEPGRKTRTDVHMPVSSIDILPTLLHVTGQQKASWTEGVILPPFSDSYLDENRSIYALEARKNEKHAPLNVATTALIKGQYKLIYFFGYEELGFVGERIELYDIRNDPEEMNDLYSSKRETANEMLHELKAKLAEVDEPYLA